MKIDKNLLVNPSTQRPLGKGLFIEAKEKNDLALFSIASEDHLTRNGKLIYSLKKLFLDLGDASEYAFATTYFLGWDHWNKVRNLSLVSPYVSKWQAELNLKIRSEAFEALRESGANGSVAANTLLLTSAYMDGMPTKATNIQEKADIALNRHMAPGAPRKPVQPFSTLAGSRVAGRPRKAPVEPPEAQETRIKNQLAEDFARLGKHLPSTTRTN